MTTLCTKNKEYLTMVEVHLVKIYGRETVVGADSAASPILIDRAAERGARGAICPKGLRI